MQASSSCCITVTSQVTLVQWSRNWRTASWHSARASRYRPSSVATNPWAKVAIPRACGWPERAAASRAPAHSCADRADADSPADEEKQASVASARATR